MNRTHIFLAFGFILLAVGIWLGWQVREADNDEVAREANAKDSSAQQSGGSRHRSDRKRAEVQQGEIVRNRLELEGDEDFSEVRFDQLKRELEEYSDACTGWISPEFKKFMQGLVDELGYSPELLEILKLIESPKYGPTRVAMDFELKRRLQDPASVEERMSFVAAAGEPGWSSYSDKLCWYAGEACSKAEYDDLVRLSSESGVVRNLELGFNLSLVKSDPIAALESTMAFYNEQKSGASTILSQLIGRLPTETDFPAIDALLPLTRSDDGDPHSYHANFFETWGSVDPGEAANYLVGNSDRFPPAMMKTVVAPYARDHTDDALAWVQEFPRGAYFDEAVSAVVDQIMDTRFEEARELAAKIGDAGMRNESLKMIAIYESGDAREDQ